ncbi:hypothetical protein L6452_38350 [Arctium lappa]|uniref:Uncharacterized protein n=1 Tax=Arctium lappa TaxID=4217 RepID=A0ACB8Y601_ARCLA|nr:hypothetical protein L6452_38350 [Arctium lappa]
MRSPVGTSGGSGGGGGGGGEREGGENWLKGEKSYLYFAIEIPQFQNPNLICNHRRLQSMSSRTLAGSLCRAFI